MYELEVYSDPAHLAQAAAAHFVARAEEAVVARGRFAVALSGGSTPRATYALLADSEFAARTDWLRTHVFWGDERCVPPDHPKSNYRMAREMLLDRVPIPAHNVHRIRGEMEPKQAAREYVDTLRAFFGKQPRGVLPRFDLILLGMGGDGHTASLFPGAAAIHEERRWVVAQFADIEPASVDIEPDRLWSAASADRPDAWRVTLTPTIINAAAHVTFLVSGAAKAAPLQEVLEGPHQPDVLPAQIVRPTDGRLLWLVDEAAAADLERGE